MAKKVSVVISHWYHLIEGLQDSPQRFYALSEEAIKRRTVPDIKISHITYREGGILSAKREYLRIGRKEYLFDICAAPFGNGFFISWWLGEALGFFWRLMLVIPIWGELLWNLSRPATYYRLDTALMFQEMVHSAVLDVVDALTEAKGLRGLSESERKPILRELFKR